MASKKEEVLIYLKAIGAANARRAIDSVSDALDRLDGKTNDNTMSVDKNTDAVDDNVVSHKKNKKIIAEESVATERANRRILTINKSYVNQNKILADIARKARAAKRVDQQRITSIERVARAEALSVKRHVASTQRMLLINNRARIAEARARARDYALREKELKVAEKRFTKIRNKSIKQFAKFKVLIPHFSRPGFLLKWATIILGVLDLIPVVGTALNAMLAGAVASVNGLMPIAGLIGLLPAGIGALTQFGIIFAGISMASKDFAKSNQGLLSYWTEVTRESGQTFFKVILPGFRELTEKLMPKLNKQLQKSAKGLGESANGFMTWLSGKEGLVLFNKFLSQNAGLIKTGSAALFQFAKLFLRLAVIGGPTLQHMLDDFLDLGKFLDDQTKGNSKGIAGFFEKGYKSFKRAGKIVGNFLKSLYYIFRLSSPLTKELSDSLYKSSVNLLKWVKSKKGIQAIKDYFKDMTPPLRAIGRLAGTLVKAIFKLSRSKNFTSLINEINDTLVPALVKIIESVDGNFIRLFVSFVENIAKLASNTAFVDVLIELGQTVTDILGAFADWYGSLSPFQQKFAVWTLVIAGLFGNMAISIIGALAGIVTTVGGTLAALKKVRTARANLAGAGAGGGTTGGGGGGAIVGGGGKGKKKGKGRGRKLGSAPRNRVQRVAGGAATGLGAFLGASAIGGIFDIGRQQQISGATTGADQALSNLITNAKGADTALDNLFDIGSGFNNFEDALKGIANPNAFNKFTIGVGNMISGIAGLTPASEVAKTKFEALDTQLTNLPADQAATAFSKIKTAAEKQKIPVDKLVGLFPQYRDKVKGTVNPTNDAKGAMNTAADAAFYMSRGINAINNNVKNFSLSRLREINAEANRSLGLGGNTGPRISANFAGGLVGAGETSMTGELGPEFTLTRGGHLGIVGLGGPQLYRPSSDTAIIPASATSDPANGNYGNTPDWARMALQSAFGNNSKGILGNNNKRSQESSSVHQYDISFAGATIGSNVDIASLESAVRKGIEEADRDRRERSGRSN